MPRERKTRTSTEVLHYLITLSETNREDELPNEWNFIIRWHRNSKDNNCLCRQLIKNQNYYYNWKTKKVICLGDSCQYTYGFKERRIKNDEWRDYYINAFKFLTAGNDCVWLDSFDLEEYCKNNYILIMEHIISSLPKTMNEFELMEFKEMITEVWGIRLGIVLAPVYDVIEERLDEIKLKEEEEDRLNTIAKEQKRIMEEKIKQEALELLEIKEYEAFEQKKVLEKKALEKRLKMEKEDRERPLKRFIDIHMKLYEGKKQYYNRQKECSAICSFYKKCSPNVIMKCLEKKNIKINTETEKNKITQREKILVKFMLNHLKKCAWKNKIAIMNALPPCENFNFCGNKSVESNGLGNGTKWCNSCFI